jgi:hypothetical protein
MAIPSPPEMTPGGSTIQLCSDFQSWLLWAKEYHPTAPPEIRKEAERRAQLCESSLDDNTKTDKLEPTPMAKTKPKPKPAAEPPINKRAVGVPVPEGDKDFEFEVSRAFIRPTVTAALTMQPWNSTLSVNGLRGALMEQIDKVDKGDLSRPENILLCQAHTLDFLFSELCQQAHNNQTYIANYESIMRMAFRAQNQCRMTLETLANIKNPPVVFAKQANISQGHQQINNGVPSQASHAEENQNLQNKILEHTHGERLDTREKSEAVPVNSHMEALGEEHRAKIGSG